MEAKVQFRSHPMSELGGISVHRHLPAPAPGSGSFLVLQALWWQFMKMYYGGEAAHADFYVDSLKPVSQ